MENKNGKYIKFDNETDKLIIMKLITFINNKLGQLIDSYYQN